MRLTAATAWLWVALCCTGAEPPPPGDAPLADPPLVTVRRVDGQDCTGQVQTLGDGELVITQRGDGGASGRVVRVPLVDVIDVRWRRAVPDSADAPRGDAAAEGASVWDVPSVHASSAGMPAVVVLSGGDRLMGRIADPSGDDVLRLEHTALGSVQLDLLEVDRVVMDRALRMNDPADAVATDGRDSDAVRLANGDVLTGFVTRVESEVVLLGVDDQTRRIELDRVASIVFSGGSADRKRAGGIDVQLVDASRLTVGRPRIGGGVLSCLWMGSVVRIPLDVIAVLRMRGGRWRPATARRVIEARHTPMLSVGYEHRIDRNALGRVLRVDGQSFDNGIGVHSPSRLVFGIQPDDALFVTRMGLDEAAGELADVVARIELDGVRVFEGRFAGRSALHHVVRVPVAGHHRLTLAVEAGRNGGVQGCFNWIEPGFIAARDSRINPVAPSRPGHAP